MSGPHSASGDCTATRHVVHPRRSALDEYHGDYIIYSPF